jgi:hypothetical protein
VWLAASNSEFVASTIDEIICAEILDVNDDTLGCGLVDEFMMHGPYGTYNRKCPCMKMTSAQKNSLRHFEMKPC